MVDKAGVHERILEERNMACDKVEADGENEEVMREKNFLHLTNHRCNREVGHACLSVCMSAVLPMNRSFDRSFVGRSLTH